MPDHQRVSKAQRAVYIHIPLCQIRIRVSVHVVGDIVRCLIPFGITRDTGRRGRILVDADVVKAHGCRQGSFNAREIDVRKSSGHAKVHDDCHGLHWYDSLSHVAVGANSSSIQSPCLNIGYRPRYTASWSGGVVKIIRCITIAVVPVIVDIRQAGQGLLEWRSLVSIEKCDRIIIDFDEICVFVSFDAEGEELHIRMEWRHLPVFGWYQMSKGASWQL